MNKNQIFTAEITGITSQGLGVAHFEDRAVFVKGAIPGELCEIKLVKIGKTAVYGRLERILTASPHRITPVCPHFGKCGGCDLMHMDYTLEAQLKRQRVYDVLQRIGGVDPGQLPMFPAPTDQGYRNKAQFQQAALLRAFSVHGPMNSSPWSAVIFSRRKPIRSPVPCFNGWSNFIFSPMMKPPVEDTFGTSLCGKPL